MSDSKVKKQDFREELVIFLKSISYFKSLPESCIIDLAKEFDATSIQSGEMLLREGDFGDSLYIVQTGRLLVIKKEQNKDLVLGEIAKGDIVGELALFTHETRAATVIAIRDSQLWKLSKASFDNFAGKNSTWVMPIVRTAILRLLAPRTLKCQSLHSVAIVPAGTSPFEHDFIHALIHQLSQSTSAIVINRETLHKQFKDLNTDFTILTEPQVIAWLNEQEEKYTYVFYEADQLHNEWTQLCLRQADKIILLGDAKNSTLLNETEHYLFRSEHKLYTASIELILLHDQQTRLLSEMDAWLMERPVKIRHLKRGLESDLQRFTRLLSGRAVGLVLGGGGARSLAHIGIYQAMSELNIPVDFVGGTSMGSIVAALIAMNLSIDEMIDCINRYLVHNKKLNDYTVPAVSLLGGEGWLGALRTFFGERLYIEDLWLPFFCIASNFTLRKMELLDNGPVYKAVRASASLPGVVPPISNRRDELLIDGGIFNNLPVDIMRTFASPCEIVAVRVSPYSNVHAHIPDGIMSGFKRYLSRFSSSDLSHVSSIPNFSEIIMGAITLCNDDRELSQLNSADQALDINLSGFGMLDFSKFPELVELGYQAAMEQFQAW